MHTFAFSVTVSGLDIDNTEQLDTLIATADFILIAGDTDGVTSLDVEIDATSGEEALKRFVDYLLAYPEVKIERVSEDLVNTSEIALRLDVSRETVRTWAQGARGPADFPHHRAIIGGQKIWAWATVYAWASARTRLPEDLPVPVDVACVDWFNGTHPHLNNSDSWATVRDQAASRTLLTATLLVDGIVGNSSTSRVSVHFGSGDARSSSGKVVSMAAYAGREGGRYTRTSQGTLLKKA